MNEVNYFLVDLDPESIVDTDLAPCHENARGGLDPRLERNDIATGPVPVAAAAATATREVGTVLEIGAESDPRGGTEVPIRGCGATLSFSLLSLLMLLMLRLLV